MSFKSVKVDDETYQAIKLLAQEYNLKIYDVVKHLTKLCLKYKMLEKNWIDNVVEDVIKDFERKLEEHKRKLEEELQNRINIEKHKVKLKIKHDLLMHYVKCLDVEERKEFIERLLGDINDPEFLENLDQMEVFIIDGKRKLVKSVDGKPDIPGIIKCPRGWHIPNNFCNCDRWRDCEIRREEYITYKMRKEGYY